MQDKGFFKKIIFLFLSKLLSPWKLEFIIPNSRNVISKFQMTCVFRRDVYFIWSGFYKKTPALFLIVMHTNIIPSPSDLDEDFFKQFQLHPVHKVLAVKNCAYRYSFNIFKLISFCWNGHL